MHNLADGMTKILMHLEIVRKKFKNFLKITVKITLSSHRYYLETGTK